MSRETRIFLFASGLAGIAGMLLGFAAGLILMLWTGGAS